MHYQPTVGELVEFLMSTNPYAYNEDWIHPSNDSKNLQLSFAKTAISYLSKGHSRVLIHQPLITGRMVAAAVDINIQAQEMEKLREELNGILAETSGQPLDKIQQDTDRDFYLNAKEAIEYGLADEIVSEI